MDSHAAGFSIFLNIIHTRHNAWTLFKCLHIVYGPCHRIKNSAHMRTIVTAGLQRQYLQTEPIFWITLVQVPHPSKISNNVSARSHLYDGSFPGLRIEITQACFHVWGSDRCGEPRWRYGEEGNRSLGKVLQCPVRYTVQARSLPELEIPDGFVNLVRGG